MLFRSPLLYPPKWPFLTIFYSAPYIKTTCRFSKIAKSKTVIFGPPDRPFLTIFRHRHDASINIVYIYLLLLRIHTTLCLAAHKKFLCNRTIKLYMHRTDPKKGPFLYHQKSAQKGLYVLCVCTHNTTKLSTRDLINDQRTH